jgi:hypothetical protein
MGCLARIHDINPQVAAGLILPPQGRVIQRKPIRDESRTVDLP